jgi:hypothetical protein
MAVLSDEERVQLKELLKKLQVQARHELGMDADKLPPSDY